MYPAGPPSMVISWVDWMIIMPALLPAITPMIWVKTRMAGTKVWTMRAARGPIFLTVQPEMKRFTVPGGGGGVNYESMNECTVTR